MIRKIHILLAFLVICWPASLLAQNVTGNYRLEARQSPGQNDCVWTGTLQLAQSGGNPGSFTGSGSANLTAGGAPCANFVGTATGTINGATLDFGIGVGALGTVAFNGTVGGDGSLTGSWAGFATFSGTWLATPVDTRPVPLLPWPAFMFLLAAVAGIGAFYSKHRRRE